MRFLPAVVSLVVVLSVAAGCGDDDSANAMPDAMPDADVGTIDSGVDSAMDVSDAAADAPDSSATLLDVCIAEFNRQVRCGGAPISLDECLATCTRPRSDLIPRIITCIDGLACGESPDSCRTLERLGAMASPAYEMFQRECLAARDRCGRVAPVPLEFCNLDAIEDEQIERLGLCLPSACGEHARCLENAACATDDSGADICVARQQRSNRCRLRPLVSYADCVDSYSCVPVVPARAAAVADCIDGLSCAESDARCMSSPRPPAVVTQCRARLATCGGFSEDACDLELATDATASAMIACLEQDCDEVGLCVNELLSCRVPETLCDASAAWDERCGREPRDRATCEAETRCVRSAAEDAVALCLNSSSSCTSECFSRPASEVAPRAAAVAFEERCRERAAACGLPRSLSACDAAAFTDDGVETMLPCFDVACGELNGCLEGVRTTCSTSCSAALTPPFGSRVGDVFPPFTATDCGSGAPQPLAYASCQVGPTVILASARLSPYLAESRQMNTLFEDPRFSAVRFMELLSFGPGPEPISDADCADWRSTEETRHTIVRDESGFPSLSFVPRWILIDGSGTVVLNQRTISAEDVLALL